MSIKFNDIVKQGYVRMKGSKVGLWRKKWVVLKKASSKGPSRIEKFHDETEAQGGVIPKEIILEDAIYISRLPSEIKQHAVAVCLEGETTSSSKQFVCDSAVEADDWVRCMKQVCLGRTFTASDGTGPDVVKASLKQRPIDIFNAFLHSCQKLDIEGECLLQVTQDSIHLFSANNPSHRLVTWPLTSLRRYGRDHYKFTIEAGRVCDTGEGIFRFTSRQAEEVYHRVNNNAQCLAKLNHDKFSTFTTVPLSPLNRPVHYIDSPCSSVSSIELEENTARIRSQLSRTEEEPRRRHSRPLPRVPDDEYIT